MKLVKHPSAVAFCFLWIGFVCAISFMEAWIKFRAPGITLPLGLGIGKLVFAALNKMEWGCAVAIILNILLAKSTLFKRQNLLLVLAVVVLAVQTAWLLPVLNDRADLYVQGATVPESSAHLYYVGTEMLKVILLIIFGISLFEKKDTMTVLGNIQE